VSVRNKRISERKRKGENKKLKHKKWKGIGGN
jgi:hypothetical protein